jgi:hypothetical protein
MATEYLNDGATSFAAANWATITGGAGSGFVNTATLIVPGGSNSVTGDMDWSALTSGIAWLKIAEPFSGNIGTAASPLYVDVTDGSAAEWRSDNNEGRLRHDGSGRSYLINGTVTYLRVQRGTFQAEAASTVTNAVLMGGSATFLTKTAAGTLLNVYAGSHVIQRPFTTINVYGGTLLVNVYNAAGASTINQYGGTVILYGHGNTAVTAYNHLGGALDWSKLRVDTTITTYTRQFGATVSGRPNGAALTLTNSYQRDENIGPV